MTLHSFSCGDSSPPERSLILILIALTGCSGTLVVGHGSTTGAPLANGCSDQTREGFLDRATFPAIAGCSGGWSVPGMEAPSACNLDAGNSSVNPDGVGCAAADLCDLGFHLCNSAKDVAAHLPAGQTCAAIATASDLFFATQQSGPGCFACSGADGELCGPDGGGQSLCNNDPPNTCTDDLFGCGTAGTPTPDSSCGVLTVMSNNACSALTPAGIWSCGPNTLSNARENVTVTKLGPAGGGVICCSD